ncbi:uncharacterized protein LOC122799629 isoform X2 [Protopterus annectens]|uniref:uncharacterized protein LOC122799629 isoform X2 n=1 Tax=Protopterus annectens TaxID=7888 RepID=UPI001CF93E69|nr:uncharacterized protein LOC122799629 isoform X2 [Protopterus annectens]
MEDLKTEDILLEFKHQKASEASNILAMDNSLTAQEKELEDLKQRMAEIQMQNKRTAEQTTLTEEIVKLLMENYGKNLDSLRKIMEDNGKRYAEETLRYYMKREKELEDKIYMLENKKSCLTS